MTAIRDIPPPWIAYPGQDPWWGGWRQGESEAWLHEEWLPFWRTLDAEARDHYLNRWKPPACEWAEYLSHHWA